MGKKQRHSRLIGEQSKVFSPASRLVGFSGTVLSRRLKPLRRSRSDKVREKALEQDYLEKSNSLACQLKSHGHLLDFMAELTCCIGEDFCDSEICQELKERHAISSAVIKFLLEQLGNNADILPTQIQVSLHEMLCKDKKLKAKLKVLKGDKQGGVLKVKTSHLNQVVTIQAKDTTSVDECYQMFIHGIEADRPIVLTLMRDELGYTLREAVQKKCPNLPPCFILLHQGRKISVGHTLKEQGLTQDCNIHVHFGLYGGMEKETDPAATNDGKQSSKAPSKWRKARVRQWINEVCDEYEIERDEVSELKTLSGAGLMKLKRQDWKERSPKQGDLFFNLWTELLQTAQKSEVHTTKSPPFSPREGSAEEATNNDGASGGGPEPKPRSLSPNGEQLVLGTASYSEERHTLEQGPFGPVENLDQTESYLTVDDIFKVCPSDDELVAVRGICSSRPRTSGGAGTVLLRNDPAQGGTFLELKVDIRACSDSAVLTTHVISTILDVKVGEQFFVRGKVQRLDEGFKSMKKGFKILPLKVVVDSDHHAAFRKVIKVPRSNLRQLSVPWPTECGLFPAEGSTQEPLYQNDCLENTYGILFCPPDASPEKIKESAIALKNSQTGDLFVGVNDDGTAVGLRVSRDAIIRKREELATCLGRILPSTNDSVSICTSAVQAQEFVERNKDFVAAMWLQNNATTSVEDLEETENVSVIFRIHVVKGTSVVSFSKPEDAHAYIRVGTETKMIESVDLFRRLESLANRNIPEKTPTDINQEVEKASVYRLDEKEFLPLFKRVNFETEQKEFKVILGEPTKIILKDYIKKYAASFLNSDGGHILFGVEENRKTRIGNVVGVSISESDRKELLQESSKMICNFWPSVDSGQFFMKFIEVKCDVAKNLMKYPKTHVDRAGNFVAVSLQNISLVTKLINFVKTKSIDHFAALRLKNNRFGLLVKDANKVNVEDLLSEMVSESNKSKYFKMDTASIEEVEATLKDLCVVQLHVGASPYPIHLTSPFHTFCLDQQGVVTEMNPNQLLERFAKRRCQSDWPEKLLSAANRFEKKNTSYVLICSPFSLPKEHSDLYGLVVPDWALVLDFDQAPKQEGHLLNLFKPLHDRHQVERNLLVKTPLAGRLDLNPRNGVCWCAVRGYEDIDNTLSKEGHASWMRTHSQKMIALIEQLIAHINPNQLVVVCLWDDGHKELLRTLDMLLQFLFSCWGPTKAIFVCSSSAVKDDVLSLLVEPLEKSGFGVNKRDNIFVALPHELARHIGAELPPPYRSEDAFQIPRKFYLHDLGERTLPDTLPQTIRQAIKGHLQIMYMNASSSFLSKQEDRDKLRIQFYSGSEIDQAGLANRIAIERGKMNELKKEMKSFLKDKRSHVCLTILKAERGAGATTLCLQLLYEFHKTYVCARLLEFHYSLAANIEKINHHSKLPVILFVDSGMAYLPEFVDFKNEAERRKLNLKLLVVESDLLYGRTKMPPKKNQTIPYVVGTAAYKTVELSRELTSDEAAQLVDQFLKIKEICQDKKTEGKLNELKQRVSQECSLRKFAIVSLTAFGRKFTGLKPYVEYRLAQANELQLQILEFLALIHVHTDFLFPVNALARLTTTDVVILERIFSNHDVRELLSPPSSSEKNVRRLSFVEVAEEVLQQQAEKRALSHTLYLKDVALRLAKCALSGPRPSKRIDRITRRLYVTSEYGSEKFSPLVRYMRETDRDAAREMLHDLTEIFEKGSSVWAHLLAHLAKYYMIEYEDFPSAIPLIEEAVKENKDDVLLHHIHGDVIRLHIRNLKSKDKVCLDEILRYAIQSSHCFVTVKEKRPLMEHGYSSDALIRNIVMLAAIKSVRGSHFVDYLRAFLDQRKGNELLTTFSPEEKYVLSLVPDWFANLQGVPINEFHAKLKGSLLENVGDLDELKDLCEELKEAVKGTQDEAWVDKVALKTMSFICSLEVEMKPLQPEEADERIRSLEELLKKTGLDEESMKIWMRCVRLGSKVPTLKEVRKKMDGWLKATDRRSPNALFYNYVVAILEALSDPNDTEKMKKANECVKALQHKRRLPRSKGVSQDPSLPVEWLHPKRGGQINSLDALRHHEDLVRDYLKGETRKHQTRTGKEIIEKALYQENITKWEGVVSDISSDWKGSISLKKRISVSFVPVNVLPHMPNEGDEVRFCLAFHWSGPNAWSVVCGPAEAKNRKAVVRSAFTFPTHRVGDDSDSETSEKGDEEDLLPLVGESLHTQIVRPQEDMFIKEDEDCQWDKFLDKDMQGIILKRFPEKGYGKIYHPNFQSLLFFHAKQIDPPVDSLESIELYSVVYFTVGRSEKGPRAMNIKIVEEENIKEEKLKQYREELLQEQTSNNPIKSEVSRRVVTRQELPKTLEDLYRMGSRQEGHITEIRRRPNYKSLHGFIEIPSLSEKLFFQEKLSGIHRIEIDNYHVGAKVQFGVDRGPKGFFAKDVYIKPPETKQCQCNCGFEDFVGKGIQEGFIAVLKKDVGFGFITKEYPRERNATRLFFHESELKGCSIMQLNIGDRVHFFVSQNDKGCVAQRIDVLSGKPQFVSQLLIYKASVRKISKTSFIDLNNKATAYNLAFIRKVVSDQQLTKILFFSPNCSVWYPNWDVLKKRGNYPVTSPPVVMQGSFQSASASMDPYLYQEMLFGHPRPTQGQFSHMGFPPSNPSSRPPVRNLMSTREEPWQYVGRRKR